MIEEIESEPTDGWAKLMLSCYISVTGETADQLFTRLRRALHVTAVETGKGINADKTVKDDAHDFGVRDTIYISVKTEGAGSGTLASKVTFQDGQTVDENSQSIAPTADTYHEFHIAKASAWPKGDYKVKITLNGDSVGSKDFTIK